MWEEEQKKMGTFKTEMVLQSQNFQFPPAYFTAKKNVIWSKGVWWYNQTHCQSKRLTHLHSEIASLWEMFMLIFLEEREGCSNSIHVKAKNIDEKNLNSNSDIGEGEGSKSLQ